MSERARRLWCWVCYLAVMALPTPWTGPKHRVAMWLLPWAGEHAHYWCAEHQQRSSND